jgi:hypothetical protein
MGTHTGTHTARRSNNFFILFPHHNKKYGYIVHSSLFLNASQLTQTRHNNFPKYKEHNHMHKTQQNTHTTETSILAKENVKDIYR